MLLKPNTGVEPSRNDHWTPFRASGPHIRALSCPAIRWNPDFTTKPAGFPRLTPALNAVHVQCLAYSVIVLLGGAMKPVATSLNRSLENALDLLELLSGGPALRSREVAAQLGLRPNTANNMVRVLFRRGYVSQNSDGRYHLGPQCFFLSREDHFFRALRSLALPYLLELSGETGDNAFLGVECDGRLYMVAHAEGTNVVRATEPQKWQRQFHCTAAGKIILAERGLQWFTGVTQDEPPLRLTPRTLVSDQALSDEIAAIQASGHAQCVDEAAEGIHAIGVAVRRPDGSLVGALSQSFPSFFVNQGRIDIKERLALLHDCVRRLGLHLGKSLGQTGRESEDPEC